MDVEKTIANLQHRRFQVRRFATGAEAAAYLAEAVRGKTVGIGGCKTVDQIGLWDMLEDGKAFWHWKHARGRRSMPRQRRRMCISRAQTPSAKTARF